MTTRDCDSLREKLILEAILHARTTCAPIAPLGDSRSVDVPSISQVLETIENPKGEVAEWRGQLERWAADTLGFRAISTSNLFRARVNPDGDLLLHRVRNLIYELEKCGRIGSAVRERILMDARLPSDLEPERKHDFRIECAARAVELLVATNPSILNFRNRQGR